MRKIIDFIKNSLDDAKEFLENIEEKLDENMQGEADQNPIALDIFDQYVYYGDEVIPVSYNDKRYDYVTIPSNPKSFCMYDINGSVSKNVMLKKTYDKAVEAGRVTVSKNPDFWHVAIKR